MKNHDKTIIMKEQTFIERHAKKILLATGLIAGAGTYYMLKKHNMEICKLVVKNDVLQNKVDTLQAAASEGLYEEAIATVTRKINTVKDRIQVCETRINMNPNDVQTGNILNDYRIKLDILSDRKAKFITAQKLFNIEV